MFNKYLYKILLSILFLIFSPLQALDFGDVEVHGFASQGLMVADSINYLGDTEDGSFQFTEIGLNASYNFAPNIRLGGQVYAYQIGDYGDMDLNIDWLYLDYNVNEYFGLRLGRIKMPIGLYTEYIDLDFVRPFILLPQSIYDARTRELLTGLNGMSIYGEIPLSKAGSLDYEIFYGAIDFEDDGGIAEFFSNNLFFDTTSIDADSVWGYNFRWNTPIDGLSIVHSFVSFQNAFVEGDFNSTDELDNFSGAYEPLIVEGAPYLSYALQRGFDPQLDAIDVKNEAIKEGASEEKAQMLLEGATYADLLEGSSSGFDLDYLYVWTLSLEYVYKNFVFSFEWLRRDGRFHIEVDPISDAQPFWDTLVSPLLQGEKAAYIMHEGLAASVSWRFHDDWEIGAYVSDFIIDRRGRDNSHNGLDGDYGPLEDPVNNPKHMGWQTDFAVSLRYDVTDNWLIKAEAHYIDGSALVFNLDDQNPLEERDRFWTLFALKTTYNF